VHDGQEESRYLPPEAEMDDSIDHLEEIKRLQRCINDLVALLALPASWSGSEPPRIAHTIADALLGMLQLDFVYLRLNESSVGMPIEIIRSAPWRGPAPQLSELCSALSQRFRGDPQDWQSVTRMSLWDEEIATVPVPLGLEGEIGVVVAGSHRAEFPEQTEKLLLSVAANQALIGLQQAQLLSEQRRMTVELDERVAQRTKQLAESNQELQLQVGLLQHIPVAAWTLKPDGTPDFVNQGWLEYTGLTLEFLQSNPDAWLITIHPEDREEASIIFWEGIRSGLGSRWILSLASQSGCGGQ
jgi:PAS domain-containing protein